MALLSTKELFQDFSKNSHHAYIVIYPFTVHKNEMALPCYFVHSHDQAKTIGKYGKIQQLNWSMYGPSRYQVRFFKASRLPLYFKI